MTGGRMFLAGENGPELVVPGSTGRIYNTHDTQGIMSMVSSLLASGEHGGRQAVASSNPLNIGTVNNYMGQQTDLNALLRQSAMQAKQARIRSS